MFVSSVQLKYCCSRAEQTLTKVRVITCLISLSPAFMTCSVMWREHTFIFCLFLLFVTHTHIFLFFLNPFPQGLLVPFMNHKQCPPGACPRGPIRNGSRFCAGCSPGGPCCCGLVPDAAGEEQLERDGLEVGPQRVGNEGGG